MDITSTTRDGSPHGTGPLTRGDALPERDIDRPRAVDSGAVGGCQAGSIAEFLKLNDPFSIRRQRPGTAAMRASDTALGRRAKRRMWSGTRGMLAARNARRCWARRERSSGLRDCPVRARARSPSPPSTSWCEERVPKGLYKKARTGEIPNFTGVSDPYEAPINPELVIRTGDCTPEAAALQIIGKLEELGKLTGPKDLPKA